MKKNCINRWNPYFTIGLCQKNGISSYYYKPTGTDQETVINELWAKLIKSDTEKARISLIPSDLKLVRFSVENSSLGHLF